MKVDGESVSLKMKRHKFIRMMCEEKAEKVLQITGQHMQST